MIQSDTKHYIRFPEKRGRSGRHTGAWTPNSLSKLTAVEAPFLAAKPAAEAIKVAKITAVFMVAGWLAG